MFFEKFQTVYEGASVVYSIEAVLNIEEDNEAFHSPVAKEIIEVARRVPERVDTEYYKSHKIVKVCLLFSSNGLKCELRFHPYSICMACKEHAIQWYDSYNCEALLV